MSDPKTLRWLDPPPSSSLAEARQLLVSFGALDASGALTSHGRAMHATPLPPRMAHMVLEAGKHSKENVRRAALLALIVQERGVGGHDIDLSQRRENCERPKSQRERNLLSLSTRIADRIDHTAGEIQLSDGVLLAVGFSDRVAKRTGTSQQGKARYRLASGRGAELDASDALTNEDWLVVIDMTGRAGSARILSAAKISKAEILETLNEHIGSKTTTHIDTDTGELRAVETLRLGALDLSKPKPVKLDDTTSLAAMLEIVREQGTQILPWRDIDIQLLNRLALLHKILGDPWPELSESRLIHTLEDWLAQFLYGKRSLSELGNGALHDALMLLANYPASIELERLVPSHFSTPAGSKIPLTYDESTVTLSVRPQELFGLNIHPAVVEGQIPLSIELLSPAGRPIQLTQDLPGFWLGSWTDVRANLRGRYPKHPWPEDPTKAEPTRRAKPRKH